MSQGDHVSKQLAIYTTANMQQNDHLPNLNNDHADLHVKQVDLSSQLDSRQKLDLYTSHVNVQCLNDPCACSPTCSPDSHNASLDVWVVKNK